MSMASAQKFVSAMKSDKDFRAAVTGFAPGPELDNFLQQRGYAFDLPDLIKAMAGCMAEQDLSGSQ